MTGAARRIADRVEARLRGTARSARGTPATPGVLALAILCLGATGCRTVAYLARGGLAEARILSRREPITEMIARPDLDPDLRERLEIVLEARRFAAHRLGLRVGKSYASFADADDEAVVWVLSAAYRDRLVAYTWWYPIVGRVPYEGYFERAEAERAARRLAARDLDVDVRPASAFSTLGWFADPLLSTTARQSPARIVETVLHELFHATLFVPSAVTFNESAATFVGYRGAEAFFCGGPGDDAERCHETRDGWRRVRTHARLLDHYVRCLRALYAEDLSPAVREAWRRTRAAQAARAMAVHGLGSGEELSPPNNARLLAILAYETDLGTFDRLAPTSAALPDAIARIVEAARGSADPFASVRALAPNPLQTEPTGIDSALPWRSPPSPWTACSDVSLAGCASSGTTSRTARTCTGRGSSTAPAARAGPS